MNATLISCPFRDSLVSGCTQGYAKMPLVTGGGSLFVRADAVCQNMHDFQIKSTSEAIFYLS